MAKLTLSQAARAAGKSKTQLARMIENGKLSKEETGAGSFVIDASELMRVYPEANLKNATLRRNGPVLGDKPSGTVTAIAAVLDVRVEMLTDERNRLRVELDEARRELKAERESSAVERDRLMGIVEAAQRQLTDQREKAAIVPPPPPVLKSGWWPFRR